MAKKLLIALDVLPRHIDLFKQAGGFLLQETTERIIKIAANNVKAYLNNEPLKNEEDH